MFFAEPSIFLWWNRFVLSWCFFFEAGWAHPANGTYCHWLRWVLVLSLARFSKLWQHISHNQFLPLLLGYLFRHANSYCWHAENLVVLFCHLIYCFFKARYMAQAYLLHNWCYFFFVVIQSFDAFRWRLEHLTFWLDLRISSWVLFARIPVVLIHLFRIIK